MNLNFTSPVHPVPAPRPTSFFIEDILLHKPKPLREVPPEHFAGSLASRVPLLDYGYPLMPAPALLAPHPHPALHKPEHHHHHPYFLTTSGKCGALRGSPRVGREMGKGSSAPRRERVYTLGLRVPALPSPRLRQRRSEISTSRDLEPRDPRVSFSPFARLFRFELFLYLDREHYGSGMGPGFSFPPPPAVPGPCRTIPWQGRLSAPVRPPEPFPGPLPPKFLLGRPKFLSLWPLSPCPHFSRLFSRLPRFFLGAFRWILIARRVIAPFPGSAEPHLLGRARMGCFQREKNKRECEENRNKAK